MDPSWRKEIESGRALDRNGIFCFQYLNQRHQKNPNNLNWDFVSGQLVVSSQKPSKMDDMDVSITSPEAELYMKKTLFI